MPIVTQERLDANIVDKNETACVPPTTIAMEMQSNNASNFQGIDLLDKAVDKNMMSHQTWRLLGKPHKFIEFLHKIASEYF